MDAAQPLRRYPAPIPASVVEREPTVGRFIYLRCFEKIVRDDYALGSMENH